MDELEQRQRLRHAADERDGVVAEARLQRRVLEELVERDLRDRLALELDVDAHAVLVGVIGERVVAHRDLGQHLVLDELRDLLDHAALAALADAVGKLGDDDRVLAAAQLLDVRAGTHDDPAASCPVGVANTAAADDVPARREVGPLHVLHQTLGVDVRLLDHRDHGVDHFPEVVRRDVRRHPDGDPRRAVHEQVREPRGKDVRLAPRLVVVRLEVDRVGVDVAQHLGRETCEPALGVAHRGRGIPVERAEVPLAVDERVAQRERLRHAHERVVDRRVAVRVVIAHDRPDDVRRLLVRAVRLQPVLEHAVENAAVNGLEPVANVRQRAADDDGHRVVEEAGAHLLLQLAALDAAAADRIVRDLRHRGSGRPLRSAR